MFDQDKAWQTATIRALKICLEADLFPQILEVQWYKDIDEYAQHHTTIDITGTDALSFVIGSSVEQYPLDSPITRQQYQNQIFDLIASIRDVWLAQFYLDKVADVLWLSQSIMTLTFSKWFKTRQQLIRKKDEPVLSSQPTDEQTIQSLIYQDFVQPYMTSEVDEGISIVCALWDLYDPAKLSEIFEHNDNFNELHLRRAKQLDTLSSDRQSIVIIQLIKSAIKKYYTHVLRDSHQWDLNRRIISFLK